MVNTKPLLRLEVLASGGAASTWRQTNYQLGKTFFPQTTVQAVFSTENLSRIHMNLDIYITTTWLMASPLFLCVPICLPIKKKTGQPLALLLWDTSVLSIPGTQGPQSRGAMGQQHGRCSSRAQVRRWLTA